MGELITEDDQILDKVVQEQIDMLKDSKSEPPGLASAYTGQGWSQKSSKKEPDTTIKEVVEHTKKEMIAKVTGPQGMLPDDHPLQPKAKRAPRNKAAKQVVKSSSASEIIDKLQGQMDAVKYIDSIVIPDIPQMPVRVREILIIMQKELETVKGAAINTIIDQLK